MKKVSLVSGGFIGFILGFPLIAIFYFGERMMLLKFLPLTLFDAISRILPGYIITSSIDIIVRFIKIFGLGPTDVAAKHIEQIFGLILFLFITTSAGVFTAFLMRSAPFRKTIIGMMIGLILFLFSLGVSTLAGTSAASLPVILSAIVNTPTQWYGKHNGKTGKCRTIAADLFRGLLRRSASDWNRR